MIDLNRIATFVQAVQSGSFAAAGRRLGVPSNTVSRRVQQLEADLSTRLLHRSTRKLSLTAAGQQFFDRCAAGIGDLQSAQYALVEASQLPTGTLRVTGPADFFDHFKAEWFAEFMARYPNIKADFRLTDDVTDLVSEGIDLAFRGGAMPDSQFIARRLLELEWLLVASPAYLAKHGNPSTLAELASHDCLPPSGSGNRRIWRLAGRAATKKSA